MNLFLALLRTFFFPAVEGDGGDAGAQGAGAGNGGDQGRDPGTADDDLNLDLGEGGGEGGEGQDQDPAALLAREREERKAERERFERELSELRGRSQAPPPAQPPVDRQWEEEERTLNDPNSTDLQKWQVNANRELRAGRQQSAAAVFHAQDMSDKSSFDQLAVTKPGIYKKYGARVEEELAKMRKNGGNAPRLGILQFLIGKDAMEGNLKAKPKAKQAGEQQGSARGRTPGARSDVGGRGGAMTEHEKRMKRLEGVQI